MQSLLVFFAFVGQASALALSTAARPMRAAARSAVSMKVGLVYSTTTGNTETVAGYLADRKPRTPARSARRVMSMR